MNDFYPNDNFSNNKSNQKGSYYSNGNREQNNSYPYNQNIKHYNNGYNSYNGYNNSFEDLKTSSFYNESYRKNKKNNGVILQMVIVGLICSIVGGAIGASFQVWGASSLVGGNNGTSLIGSNLQNSDKVTNSNGQIKEIKIVDETSSPVTAIAEKVSPSIVGIKVTYTVKSNSFFWGEQQYEGGSEGSGIIIREDGYILTNNHVIEGAVTQQGLKGSKSQNKNTLVDGAKIEVILASDINKTYVASVVGRDEKTDLAIIKIDAGKLPAVDIGNSDELKVGELAVAIGNPAGIEYMGSVTAGIISGLNRRIPVGDNQFLRLIQTDAAINPGNSGGALLNSEGQVIGVNTAKIGGAEFEGLGFAIPINKAMEVANSLIEYTYVKGRPAIGIIIDREITKDTAEQYKVPTGVMVGDIVLFGAAQKAGIEKGDIITKFNGKRIETFAQLEEEKFKHKPGETVEVELYRFEQEPSEGEYITIKLVLGEDEG